MLEKFLAFLRKIGMLQSGSETWSGDASNRPLSMTSDDLDLSEGKGKAAKPGAAPGPAKKK